MFEMSSPSSASIAMTAPTCIDDSFSSSNILPTIPSSCASTSTSAVQENIYKRVRSR